MIDLKKLAEEIESKYGDSVMADGGLTEAILQLCERVRDEALVEQVSDVYWNNSDKLIELFFESSRILISPGYGINIKDIFGLDAEKKARGK